MPPHHHRSGQKANKAHKNKKNAGPNLPHNIPGLTPTTKINTTVRKIGGKKNRSSKSDSNKRNNGTSNSMSKSGSITAASLLSGISNDLGDRPDSAAPLVVAFIAFHDSANPMLLKRKCLEILNFESNHNDIKPYTPTTVLLPAWAQPSSGSSNNSNDDNNSSNNNSNSQNRRLTLLDVPTRDKFQILDICKVADIIVPCFGPHCKIDERCIDDLGYDVLTTMKNQGLPCCVGAVQGLTPASDSSSTFNSTNKYQSMVKELNLGVVEEVDGNEDSSGTKSIAKSSSKNPIFQKKKALETFKLIQRFFASDFGGQKDSSKLNDSKIFPCDTETEIQNFLRCLGNVVVKELSWRKDRGYMMVQKADLVPSPESESDQGQVLQLTGYVRGQGFSPDDVVHITNVGDFPILKIRRETDICGTKLIRESKKDKKLREKNAQTTGADFQSTQTVSGVQGGFEKHSTKDVKSRLDDMVRLLPYDPLQGEQTWPSKQEMSKLNDNDDMSDSDSDADNDNDKMIIPDADENAIPKQLTITEKMKLHDKELEEIDNHKQDKNLNNNFNSNQDNIDNDNYDNNSEGNWSIDDLNQELFRFAEDGKKKEQMGFEERAQEDLEFPDEVDTPIDQPASERFQRYRGLRSFKSSVWDAYEELPISYSRIWEYQGFKSCCNSLKMKHKVEVKLNCTGLNSSTNSMAMPGLQNPTYLGPSAYVSIFLEGVKEKDIEKIKQHCRLTFNNNVNQTQTVTVLNGPLIVSSLFETERKISVMHVNLNRVNSATDIADDFLDRSIKSKTLLEFHCGFRKFTAKPIFSTLPKKSSGDKDKHMYTRYLHPAQTCIASFFAPVIFAPCPTLVFELRGENDTQKEKDFSINESNSNSISKDAWMQYWSDQRFQSAMKIAEKEAKLPVQHRKTGIFDAFVKHGITINNGGITNSGTVNTFSNNSTNMDIEVSNSDSSDTKPGLSVSISSSNNLPLPVLESLQIPNMKTVQDITSFSSFSHYNTYSNLKNLLAWGEVQDANPKKLIIKRSILTGYPFRIHKNKAVIRHMFFSPEDIRYFKPVELSTKQGLRGNIKESLGTHGIFKAIFSDRMKQNDTVCMNLYKRQFPCWYPPTWGGRLEDGPDSEVIRE